MEDKKIVYITPKGDKYHIDKNCKPISGKKNILQISLSEAEKRKKPPCKVCSLDNNNNNMKNRKINNNYKNNKKKKFRNFIESEDADDTIFNDTSFLSKSNNKIIANVNNKKENIKENNHGFIIEEKKSEDSEIDFNNFNNEIKNNNITNSSIYSQFCSRNKSDNEDSNEDSEEDSENSDQDSERVKEIDVYEDEKNERKLNKNNVSKNIKNKNNNIFDSSIISNVEYKIKESDKCPSEKNRYNKNIIEEHKSIDTEKKDDSINEINNENDDYSQTNNNIENNIEFNPINNNYNINNNNNLYLKNNEIQKYYSNNNPNNNFFRQQIINNINNNIYKNNFICQKYDMNFLEETYNHATILSFNKGNISIDSNCQKIDNGLPFKDSYMFKFEISQLNPNFNETLKIDVGFKIKYTNPGDINFIEDENSININNMKYKIGSLYDYIKINKRLIIFKNMGPIYALINISKGKFFIIGKKELEKRKQNIFLDRNNTEIFYVQNFLPISPNNLRSIKPSFNPNKAQVKYFEIKMNEELKNKK